MVGGGYHPLARNAVYYGSVTGTAGCDELLVAETTARSSIAFEA